ncbi:MAG: hypothetical protein K0R05_4253 [Anaerocolumna sp.]|jgi:hypothetical protein|nr:hypothetical protein [Anaerocolumna sp.]
MKKPSEFPASVVAGNSEGLFLFMYITHVTDLVARNIGHLLLLILSVLNTII